MVKVNAAHERYHNAMLHLFTLRVKLFIIRADSMIVINVWEKGFQAPNHTRLDVEVRQGGKVIFPRGVLYCGIPSHCSIDGNHAKEAVLSLVAMKPGDTDRDYFKDYSAEQLEWAEHNGEALDCERLFRYCDQDGNVKGR